MQKFTRSLTREIDIGGERVAVTLDAAGVTLRLLGTRRPPHTITWPSIVCAAAKVPDQIAEAVQAIKKGGEKTPDAAPAPVPDAEASHRTETPPSSLSAPPPASNAAALTHVLERIEGWLALHRASFRSGLLPGATDAECAALATALGQPVPGELQALLRWHNGQSDEAVGAFERDFFLMSTEQIASALKELVAEPSNGWKPGLVPFLDDEQDDFVCLDTTAPGVPVVECWRGQSTATETAPSLTAWLEGFFTALEKGEYIEDPERGSFRRKS
jgi:cell wall assembly regulator SMI1